MLPYEMFETAVFNNPHGYGIVFKKNNSLRVVRECPEGGTDPEELYKLLEKEKNVKRFVHLRWKTAGEIDLDNTQPFLAFKRGKKEIYFMHNGTLDQYVVKPPTTRYGAYNSNTTGYGYATKTWEDEEEEALKDASDSKRYCELKLKPLLERLGNGKGIDFNDPVISDIISKFWTTSGTNRGILIPNDQSPFYFSLSNWAKVETKDGNFLASNNLYFNKLQRGYEFDRREAERKAKEEQERKNRVVTPSTAVSKRLGIEDIRKWNTLDSLVGGPVFDTTLKIDDYALKHIIEDWDLYDEKGFKVLNNLSVTELMTMAEKMTPEQMAYVLHMLTDLLRGAAEKNIKYEDKLLRASKHIESLKLSNIHENLGTEDPNGFKITDAEGNLLKISKIDKETRRVTIETIGEQKEQRVG